MILKHDTYFSKVSKETLDQYESKIKEKFEQEDRFPYVFPFIMQKICTLFQDEVQTDASQTLSMQSSDIIKNALKQLLPGLVTVEEEENRFKNEKIALEHERTALLNTLQLPKDLHDCFKPASPYTDDTYQTTKANLTAEKSKLETA